MDKLPYEMLLHVFSFTIAVLENNEILNYLLINKSLFNFLEEYLDKFYFKEKVFNKFLFFCNWNEILQNILTDTTFTNNITKKSFYYPLPFPYRILYFKLNNFWNRKKQYCLQNNIFTIQNLPCKNFTIQASIFGDCKVGKTIFRQKLLKDKNNFCKMIAVNKNIGTMCLLTCYDYNLNVKNCVMWKNYLNILMFKLNDLNSFEKLKETTKLLYTNCNVPVFVIGTHKDLIENNEKNRQVTSEMVLQFMKEQFLNQNNDNQSDIIEPWYFEVSNTKENDFNYILEEMIRQTAFQETHTNWNRIVWKILNGKSVEKYVTDVRVEEEEECETNIRYNETCNIL
ncbi:hypothetical protein ABK040_003131 [Willaertia magna]